MWARQWRVEGAFAGIWAAQQRLGKRAETAVVGSAASTSATRVGAGGVWRRAAPVWGVRRLAAVRCRLRGQRPCGGAMEELEQEGERRRLGEFDPTPIREARRLLASGPPAV